VAIDQKFDSIVEFADIGISDAPEALFQRETGGYLRVAVMVKIQRDDARSDMELR
jgi:hypothetical protein